MTKPRSLLLSAANLLKSGEVGVIPTDTIYGLVCVASNETAVDRLYSLKKREGEPGTIIAADLDQLVSLGIKYRYLKAVEQYWPGKVSVVVPLVDFSKNYLHRGKLSLAVRIPKDKELKSLLEMTGPLVTSSANITTKDAATNIKQAKDIFGDKIGFYVDGGDLSRHLPSTVIRIVDDAVEVLREGTVKV